ncbi:MAG: methyltransferase domain-containing protein [Pikeienuella sp.]
MSVFKRIERYVSAFFKLGRISRQAKGAAHSVTVIEPRVHALTQDVYELSDRHWALERKVVDEIAADIETKQAALSDEVAERLRQAEEESRNIHGLLVDSLDELKPQLGSLTPRIGTLEGRLDGVEARLDGSEGWLQTAEARIDGFETQIHRIRPEIETLRADGARFVAEKELLRADIGQLKADLDGWTAQRDALRAEVVELKRARDGLIGDRDAMREQIARLTERLDTLIGRVNGGEGHFQSLEAAFRTHKESTQDRFTTIEKEVSDAMRPEIAAQADRLRGFEGRVDRVAGDIASASRAYTDISRRVDLLRFGSSASGRDTPPLAPEAREGLAALMDAFYGRLEDRFRGARSEIKERLRVYLPDIRAAVVAAPGRAVLDLGCGRGEWVELLAEVGIEAHGVDLNPVQIEEAVAMGLPVSQGDALKALAETPDGALAAVTAHHLIEHLPFETLTWMTREALRALAPGGVLIYETPNCQNLIVGASTFHIDPTHVKPLPPQLLSTLLDTVGFHPVETRPLHPSETRDVFLRDDRADPYLAELMFGPQDLAMLARKPVLA